MAKTVSLIIKELKKRLSEFLTLVDLRVVGLRARGDCEVSSNMDVIIEVENPDRDTKKIFRMLSGKWVLNIIFSFHRLSVPVLKLKKLHSGLRPF